MQPEMTAMRSGMTHAAIISSVLALALTTGLAAGGGGVDGGSEEARCESAAAADRQCDAGLRDAQRHALLQSKAKSAKAPASLDDAEDGSEPVELFEAGAAEEAPSGMKVEVEGGIVDIAGAWVSDEMTGVASVIQRDGTFEISNPNAAWSPANSTIRDSRLLQLAGDRRRCCTSRRRRGKETNARSRNCQWDISAQHRRRMSSCKGCTGRRRRGIRRRDDDIKCDKCEDSLFPSSCPSKCIGYGTIAPVCRHVKLLDGGLTVDDCTKEAGEGYMPLVEKSTATSPYSAEWNMCIKAGKILGVNEYWSSSTGTIESMDHEPRGCFYSTALDAIFFNRHPTGIGRGKEHAQIICVQKDAGD